MGKGSTPRPFTVTKAQFAANWEQCFGNDANGEQGDSKSPTSTGLESSNLSVSAHKPSSEAAA